MHQLHISQRARFQREFNNLHYCKQFTDERTKNKFLVIICQHKDINYIN